MKNALIVASVVFVAGLVWAAVPEQAQDQQTAQTAAAREVTEMESLADVLKVNKKSKTVQIKDAQGRKITLNMPADVYDVNRIKTGSRLNIRYLEPMALSVTAPGTPSTPMEETVRVTPKLGQPS